MFQALILVITEAKLYVPVVTLSSQDNAKLLPQLKSNFKRKINWNKFQPPVPVQVLDYSLIQFFR